MHLENGAAQTITRKFRWHFSFILLIQTGQLNFELHHNNKAHQLTNWKFSVKINREGLNFRVKNSSILKNMVSENIN